MHVPAGQKVSQTFVAVLENLYPMLHLIRDQASKTPFDEVTLSRIELACEEALVNIIEYAYSDDAGEVSIEVESHPSFVRITLIDTGIEFDPLAHSKKFLVKSLENNHTIGGYGTFFIMKMMDEVQYKREGDKNMLTLIKKSTNS